MIKLSFLRLYTILSLTVVVTACTSPQDQIPDSQPATDSVQAATGQVIKSPNDSRDYRIVSLDNAIDVLLVSDPATEKSAAALSVGVGFYSDPMSQQGMAHYLEHMLFLGTEKYPDTAEYSEFINQNGGANNAYTWTNVTNYNFNIKNEKYDEALDRFSDFFKAPKLYPEYAEKEKNAVNAEWSMRREFDFFGQFKLKRQLMGEHPANRFLIGNLETLGDKEGSKLHDETVKFYNDYYSANLMKVAMLSNLSLDEMEVLARKHFSSIENKQIVRPAVTEKVESFGKRRIYYVPNQDVKQIQLDFTIENNIEQFAYKPNTFLTYLLGSEMPGTPAYVLKELGLIEALSGTANPNLYGNYGTLQISVSLTDKGMQQRDYIVATIMQYLELVRRNGVDEKYFNEIRTSLNNQFRFLEKIDEYNYVSNLAQSMQDYPLANAINAVFEYNSFNREAIEQTLEQLTPDNLLIWYISQQEQADKELHFYKGRYRIEPIADEEISSWQQPSLLAMKLPAVNQLLPENFELYTVNESQALVPTLVLDQDGILIWRARSENFANQPRGRSRIVINREGVINDAASAVMLDMWADIYNIQQSTLATEASIAGMGMGLSASNGLIFDIFGFTDKQGELLAQALNGLNIELTNEIFEQAVDRFIRSVQNSEKRFAYSQVLSKWNGVIESGSFENEKLVETASSISKQQLQQFIISFMQKNQIRVFMHGNYNQDSAIELASIINQAMPQARMTTEFEQFAYIKPVLGQTLVYSKDIPVDDVAIMDMYVHPEPGFAAKAAAQILASHYGNIAFDTLRTEEQLAYAVAVLYRPIDEYAAIGLLIQTPVKNAQDMQTRFDQLNRSYAEILNQMTQEEFATLKESQLITLNQAPKNLAEEVSPLLRDWQRENFNFDSRDKLISATEALTLEDLQAFFVKTIASESPTRINLQLRGAKFSDQPFASFDGQISISALESFHSNTTYQ